MKQLYTMRVLLLTAFVYLTTANICPAQNVGINTTGTPPDPTAILDLSSTTQGFLMPRMTVGQRDAITSPAEGLTIYNLTSGCLNIWSNGSWFELCSGINQTGQGCNTIGGTGTADNYNVPCGSSVTLHLSDYNGSVQWGLATDNSGYPYGIIYNPPGTGGDAISVNNYPVNYYWASVQDGNCGIVYTNIVTVTTTSTAIGGTASANNSSIGCGDSVNLSLGGYSGSIQWQSSTDGTNYSDITGATSATATAAVNYLANYFRATVTDACGNAVYSTVANVTGVSTVAGGTASANPSAVSSCGGASTLSVTGYSGMVQWQSSTNNTTFNDISGATTATYTALVNSITYFRAKVTDPCSSNIAYSGSTEVTISGIVNCAVFTATETEQTLTVPDGVTLLYIDAYGAAGNMGGVGAVGGAGGRTQAQLTVTPGSTIYIYVGDSTGYNGGANGGAGSGSGGNGGTGGGASDVRQGGNSTASIVIIAGGGGGGGGGGGDNCGCPNPESVGGDAGGNGQSSGNSGVGGGSCGSNGGNGGTQSNGGSGGSAATCPPGGTNGTDGGPFAGGTGGDAAGLGGTGGGGGGGGGYYGGGGGGGAYWGGGSGGGGGASWADSSVATNISYTGNNTGGAGQVVFSW